mmetsp:Transcript_37043/g.76989  ORF Transcript_37043/g.76989 Transcript_37043/m.76989 type:complete len:459 (-) Transcript_37043:485-1861(-)
MEDILTRFTFFAGKNAHLFKQGNVLFRRNAGSGFNTRVNTPDTTVSEFLLHCFIIVVTVEDDLPVLLESFTGHISSSFTGFNAVSKFAKLLSDNGVENSVHHGDILGRSDSTEFKSATSVREGGGTVTILSWNLEGDDFSGTEVKGLLARLVLGFRTIHECLKVVGHVTTKVCRDDGGGSFASTQTEVISWGSNGHAHQITMFIDSRNDGSHDDREGSIISSGLQDALGIKNIDSVTSGDGPVVVLSGSVDFVERLLLEKSSKTVLGSNFFNDLHNHQVLINLGGVGSVKRSKFKLVRSDLTMTGLEGNSHLPAFILNFLHASQSTGRSGEGGHVVITHFLSTRGVLSDKSTSSQLKIGAAVEVLTFNEEDLLFETNVGNNSRTDIKAKSRHEALSMLVNGGVGTEQWGLFIKSSTIVRHEDRGDEDGVAAEEDGRGGIDGEVSTGLVSSTESSIGVR